jgi:hypothetical protein
MRLLSTVILILLSAVNGLRNQFPMYYTISLRLKININNFNILIHCSPLVILLAVDFDEDFIDVKCVTTASVFSLQSPCINGAKLDVEPAP